MLVVVTASHDLATTLSSEVTLSQRLHTLTLPSTHALVGYWWQNTRLHPFVFSWCSSYSHVFQVAHMIYVLDELFAQTAIPAIQTAFKENRVNLRIISPSSVNLLGARLD